MQLCDTGPYWGFHPGATLGVTLLVELLAPEQMGFPASGDQGSREGPTHGDTGSLQDYRATDEAKANLEAPVQVVGQFCHSVPLLLSKSRSDKETIYGALVIYLAHGNRQVVCPT